MSGSMGHPCMHVTNDKTTRRSHVRFRRVSYGFVTFLSRLALEQGAFSPPNSTIRGNDGHTGQSQRACTQARRNELAGSLLSPSQLSMRSRMSHGRKMRDLRMRGLGAGEGNRTLVCSLGS